MEPVNRKICATALTNALEKKEKFVEEAIKKIIFLKWFYTPPSKPKGAMSPQQWMFVELFYFFSSIWFFVFLLAYLFPSLNFFPIPLIPLTVSMVLGPPYIMMIIVKKEKKEIENFNQKFPELAKIIKIEEETEN